MLHDEAVVCSVFFWGLYQAVGRLGIAGAGPWWGWDGEVRPAVAGGGESDARIRCWGTPVRWSNGLKGAERLRDRQGCGAIVRSAVRV